MASDGGLGSALVGERLVVGTRTLHVSKLLGEGEYFVGYSVIIRG